MKFADIQGLSVEELSKKIRENEAQQFEAKMKNSMGQLGNPLSLRGIRRDVARLKTALNQKLTR